MKRKVIVLLAVLCLGVMSFAGCSTDGKNNNSATDDRANKNTLVPTDNVGDNIGNDIEKGVDDLKTDAADLVGTHDANNGVDLSPTGGMDNNATDNPTDIGTSAMPTNNANDMVTSSPK